MQIQEDDSPREDSGTWRVIGSSSQDDTAMRGQEHDSLTKDSDECRIAGSRLQDSNPTRGQKHHTLTEDFDVGVTGCRSQNNNEMLVQDYDSLTEESDVWRVTWSRSQDNNAKRNQEHDTLTDDTVLLRTSGFRTALPQVLATLAQCLQLLALGMVIGVPTIVIAALLHSPTGLSMNSSQASWFAGVLLASQPLGSILSGVLSETLGRKRCMMAVNMPLLGGWALMYLSQNLPLLYLSSCLLGLSIGFMEAPGLSYLGETCQPHLRAQLCSLTSISIPLGYLVIYLMGTLMPWRTVAACTCILPVITVIALFRVPESPMWLLKKGRVSEAESALCWLRGWVTPTEIKKEFRAMQAHSDTSQMEQPQTRSPKKGQVYTEVPKSGNGPRLEAGRSSHNGPTFREKLKDLTRPEMMRPLLLVVLFFFFYHCGGVTGLRPYMVKVFHQLELTIDPYWLTVASAFLQIAGAVVCSMTIHRIGKRKISMISMVGCAGSVMLLGVYSYLTTNHGLRQPYIPMTLFALLYFFTNVGILPVPWILISEVFPSRDGSLGGGVSSAIYYIFYFFASKTFLDMEGLLGLHGVFFFYGSLGFLGLLFIYLRVPETEGKNLEEIEKFFKDKPKTEKVVPIS